MFMLVLVLIHALLHFFILTLIPIPFLGSKIVARLLDTNVTYEDYKVSDVMYCDSVVDP